MLELTSALTVACNSTASITTFGNDKIPTTFSSSCKDSLATKESYEKFSLLKSCLFVLDNLAISSKSSSVTQTIELNMYSDDPYLDERLNAPIKYGLTSLSLNEIEAIDYRDLLANGLSPRYKKSYRAIKYCWIFNWIKSF